jgi:hypothetical protein
MLGIGVDPAVGPTREYRASPRCIDGVQTVCGAMRRPAALANPPSTGRF